MDPFLSKQPKKFNKEKSLLTKVTRATMMSSLVLGLVILLIGLSLYTHALFREYITSSFSLARSSATVVERIADNEMIAGRVMNIYREMSDEERANQDSIDYHTKFANIEMDEGYQRVKRMLKRLVANSEVQYLYMGYYDQETGTLVYICDPDENLETGYKIGQWEEVPEREVRKFLNWNGEDKLYDIGWTSDHVWMCTSGYPVRNSDGETVAFILADITLGGVAKGIRLLILQYAIALAVVLFLISRFLNRRISRTVVEPINNIAEAAQNYIRDRNAGILATDHFDNLKGIRTGDEIEHLTIIMADMEHNIAAYESALTKAVSENERAHAEMNLAARIQMNMLPTVFPAFPERKEFDLYAIMDPAKEVGGDFYDFFLIDQDHLAIVMADVAGKGIPAALFMMASMIIIGNTAMTTPGYDPGLILEKSNDVICMHNHEDMFVTVWLGILDIPSGTIQAANAGHEYPSVMHPDGKYELLKDEHGFVLGTMEGMKYKSYELQLEPGARLFLYTDGVPEATDENEELFGTDRMIEALNTNVKASPEEVLNNVSKAVDMFVETAPQFDDLTMLCLEYKGGSKRHAKKDLVRRASANRSRWIPKKESEWH